MTPNAANRPIRIVFCGEISSGKSTVLQAILRRVCLPDFFGIDTRPLIRVRLGAESEDVVVRGRDGTEAAIASARDIVASEDIAEIDIGVSDTLGFGRCELIEVPSLRDGHLDEATVGLIQGASILVWTTIGNQAWRLSEKNILDEIGPARLPLRRVLVATRADKFRNEDDRNKLRDRLQRETGDYFGAGRLLGMPPALIDAADKDPDRRASGMVEFTSLLQETVLDLRAAHAEAEIVDAAEEEPLVLDTPVVEVAKPAAPDAPHGDVNEASDTEVRSAAKSAEALTEKVERASAVGEDAAPADPIEEFLSSLHGVTAFGAVKVDDHDEIDSVFGDASEVTGFANFAALSAETMLRIQGFGGNEQIPESEQIVMSNHTLLYRIKDGKVLFLAGRTATLSTGIARTAFARLAHLYDARSEDAAEAA